MAISTRFEVYKPGATKRIATFPDRDIDFDEKASLTNVLARNNTDVYTPTGDYHPSTKKYTDDGLATKKDDFTENTAFNQNFETLATEIKMNGTQAIGVSTNIAPADHVHPSDTSKEDTFTKNTAFNKNFETLTTEIKENGTQSVGVSSNVPRADHVHPKDTTKVDKITSTDNAIARYDGTTGDLQNSGIIINDTNKLGLGTTIPLSPIEINGTTHNTSAIRLSSSVGSYIVGVTGYAPAGFGIRDAAASTVDIFKVNDTSIFSLPAYNNTTANAANVYIDSTGQLYRSTSLTQYKDSINYSGIDPNIAFSLKPASYKQKQSFISVESFTVTDSFYSIDQVRYLPNFSIDVQFNCAFISGVGVGGIFNSNFNGIAIRLNEGVPSVFYSIDSVETEATTFNGDDISWLDWSVKNTYQILFGIDNLLHFKVKDANDNFITIHTFTITQSILDVIGRVSLPVAFMVANGSIEVNGYTAKSISNYEFIGFVAEDMEQVEPRLVSKNDDGEIDGIQYGQITALNNAAIQLLNNKIATLEARLVALEGV